MKRRLPFLILSTLLLTGLAFAQDKGDIPLPADPAVPALPPAAKPGAEDAKPTPVATVKPAATITPAATVKPVATAKPATTTKPTTAPKPTATPAKPTPVAKATAVPAKPTPTIAAKPAPTPVAKPTATAIPKPIAALPTATAATPAAGSANPEDMPLPVDPAVPTMPPGMVKPGADKSYSTNAAPAPAPTMAAANAAPAKIVPPIAGALGRDVPPPDNPPVAAAPPDSPSDEPGDSGPTSPGHYWNQPFLMDAMWAGTLVAIVCSYLGLFVVARRMVFLGVALAEMSSAGIALAILLSGHSLLGITEIKPLYGALACMLLGVVLFSRRWAPRRVSNDSVIGIFYVAAMAASSLMISKAPRGEADMLSLLEGNVLTVKGSETMEMLVVFIVLAILHAAFAKEFLLVSMDRDTAGTQGLAAARWDFLLFLTIGVAVALSIRSTGVLMTSAMLILPAATALLLVSRWYQAAILAPILGAVAVQIGIELSYKVDVPASAAIAAVSTAFLLPALVWRTVRQT